MNIELFKIEFRRSINAILPYAKEHKKTYNSRTVLKPPSSEDQYEFPPYLTILTVESLPGVDYVMVSVSAPMRPIKILNEEERKAVQEVFADAFPDHQIMIPRNILPGSSAFKVVALPPNAPPQLVEVYKGLSVRR